VWRRTRNILLAARSDCQIVIGKMCSEIFLSGHVGFKLSTSWIESTNLEAYQRICVAKIEEIFIPWHSMNGTSRFTSSTCGCNALVCRTQTDSELNACDPCDPVH